MTSKETIINLWSRAAVAWPTTLGLSVKVFSPKALRGKVGKVIAVGDQRTKNCTRLAPVGKIRINVKTKEGMQQLSVAQHDVFPPEFTLKDIV